MADLMRTLPFDVMLDWILTEYRENRSLFGIPESQFFLPSAEPACATTLYESRLTTPIGPAAGPHTQLAQNILSAWICGGRFIELKTVQIMDELGIPRPCIDMEDEGYNVEWSQELRLAQSLGEYVKAWSLVHVLRRLLGLEGRIPFGSIFNMSVGYNLEGILSAPMQTFMDSLENAVGELAGIRETLGRHSAFADLEIPDRITNSVTLSTMHGCPPDEIEKIARYLLEERGLHTTVKLNPTLLGKETVLSILHDRLGYSEIDIPDAVFEHDLQYDRAIELIRSLQSLAADRDLTFAVKLSNTLAMANHRDVLPGDEMYMSGRALFPVTVALFDRLIDEFDGDLNVSYSAGADALNAADLLASGAFPITVASDLLKPGGYGKLGQFVEEIQGAMAETGASSLDAFARNRRERLSKTAAQALAASRYRKAFFPHGLPKTSTPLEAFDCIEPPCVEQCAVRQDVPEYAWAIAHGDPDRALATILSRNPLPGVTGYVCTNLCQTRCTRNNYDESVAIRKLKRFAAEHGRVSVSPAGKTGHRVAVIGSGPSGLAAGYFLALSGIDVTIYEKNVRPGGMLAIAPEFRLPSDVVGADIDRIRSLGVAIEVDSPVTEPPERLLDAGFDAVYVACGCAEDARLAIDGVDTAGVLGAIEFLDRVARGNAPDLGGAVVVIGGGNTAMDAARTAQRLTGRPSAVLYRRTRAEMPAEPEEIADLLDEGNRLTELVSPLRIVSSDDRISGVECIRNELGELDPDGRRRPHPVPGSEFTVEATTVILATGQQSDLGFLGGSRVNVRSGGRIGVDETTGRAEERPIYAGGDVTRGPEIIIAACADGRRAAEAICDELDVLFRTVPWSRPALSNSDLDRAGRARTHKSLQRPTDALPVRERTGFELVEQTYDQEAARAEAERCLQCSATCGKCVEVCPNRANVTIAVRPINAIAPLLQYEDDGLESAAEERIAISQARQIVHVEDFCNACGNCTTFCVHPGEPFRDKPRLFLHREDFEADAELAFYIEADALRRREAGRESVLTRISSGYGFDFGPIHVTLDADGSIENTACEAPFEGIVSLRPAIEMIVLFEGIRSSAPHLLATSAALSGDGGPQGGRD
ncbi:putative selenate reductase subunit YgfK [Candidatus Bipolaricaulota bacterium]